MTLKDSNTIEPRSQEARQPPHDRAGEGGDPPRSLHALHCFTMGSNAAKSSALRGVIGDAAARHLTVAPGAHPIRLAALSGCVVGNHERASRAGLFCDILWPLRMTCRRKRSNCLIFSVQLVNRV